MPIIPSLACMPFEMMETGGWGQGHGGHGWRHDLSGVFSCSCFFLFPTPLQHTVAWCWRAGVGTGQDRTDSERTGGGMDRQYSLHATALPHLPTPCTHYHPHTHPPPAPALCLFSVFSHSTCTHTPPTTHYHHLHTPPSPFYPHLPPTHPHHPHHLPPPTTPTHPPPPPPSLLTTTCLLPAYVFPSLSLPPSATLFPFYMYGIYWWKDRRMGWGWDDPEQTLNRHCLVPHTHASVLLFGMCCAWHLAFLAFHCIVALPCHTSSDITCMCMIRHFNGYVHACVVCGTDMLPTMTGWTWFAFVGGRTLAQALCWHAFPGARHLCIWTTTLPPLCSPAFSYRDRDLPTLSLSTVCVSQLPLDILSLPSAHFAF